MPDQHITRLLVIRHGETAWNTESRIQGHIDIPLNDKGRWQAERVGVALADEQALDAIYSSDLQRACLTAQAIADARQLPITLDATLRERHFGHFEGKTQAEIAAHWPEDARRWRERDPSYGPEGGESLQDFYQRCIEAVQRVAAQHPGETIAIVAHGGVLDCLYRAATGVALDAPRTWHINNASVNRLLYSPEGLSLLAWGDTRHLDEGGPALDEATDGATAPTR